jgi:hypothetical protein
LIDSLRLTQKREKMAGSERSGCRFFPTPLMHDELSVTAACFSLKNNVVGLALACTTSASLQICHQSFWGFMTAVGLAPRI